MTAADATTSAVALTGVSRTFEAATPVRALRDIDLDIPVGAFVVVHGRSGSGKTTLLNVMGGLDRPDAGTVLVGGRDLTTASDAELTEIRRTNVSYIFQGFGLLPVLSAAENVEVPLRLLGWSSADRGRRVAEVLEEVGLGRRSQHRPDQMSGGEQQRVAIARAIAARPQLLIADEPTGQLDSRTGETIMELLHLLVADHGLTAVVATHDDKVIGAADRRLELADGRAIVHV
ncbi:MAG: ABC transporter ATP-binding protein [Ilumatobacteraceae bacterium]